MGQDKEMVQRRIRLTKMALTLILGISSCIILELVDWLTGLNYAGFPDRVLTLRVGTTNI